MKGVQPLLNMWGNNDCREARKSRRAARTSSSVIDPDSEYGGQKLLWRYVQATRTYRISVTGELLRQQLSSSK